MQRQNIRSLLRATERLLSNVQPAACKRPEPRSKMYSEDYRKSVVRLYSYFNSMRATAAATNVSPASICRWNRRLVPSHPTVRPSVITEEVLAAVQVYVFKNKTDAQARTGPVRRPGVWGQGQRVRPGRERRFSVQTPGCLGQRGCDPSTATRPRARPPSCAQGPSRWCLTC